jgi:ribosomal protein uS17
LIPSFAGERTPTWDVSARGAIVGLDLGVDAGDLALAVYEGTALGLKDNLERLESVVGELGPVRSVGGGAKSHTWTQIKADVLGVPIEVPRIGHGAAAGAALLRSAVSNEWTAKLLRDGMDDVALVERPAERKPITRTPKPEAERGRRQERRGVVVSSAMDKTIVVRVETVKPHPVYKKIVRRSAKFHAHDESNVAKAGDLVRIVESRPLSRRKRWIVTRVVAKAPVV